MENSFYYAQFHYNPIQIVDLFYEIANMYFTNFNFIILINLIFIEILILYILFLYYIVNFII